MCRIFLLYITTVSDIDIDILAIHILFVPFIFSFLKKVYVVACFEIARISIYRYNIYVRRTTRWMMMECFTIASAYLFFEGRGLPWTAWFANNGTSTNHDRTIGNRSIYAKFLGKGHKRVLGVRVWVFRTP